jgi:hypothetical protein
MKRYLAYFIRELNIHLTPCNNGKAQDHEPSEEDEKR